MQSLLASAYLKFSLLILCKLSRISLLRRRIGLDIISLLDSLASDIAAMKTLLVFVILPFYFNLNVGTQRIRENGEKPNIIFILADDLGWNEVSWHNRLIKTPYLEVNNITHFNSFTFTRHIFKKA